MSSRRVPSIGARKEWTEYGNTDLNLESNHPSWGNWRHSRTEIDTSSKQFNWENPPWRVWMLRDSYLLLDPQYLKISSPLIIWLKCRNWHPVFQAQLRVFLVLNPILPLQMHELIIFSLSHRWEESVTLLQSS